MDDREQQRKARHRLAVLRYAEEVSGNVAAACRYYGISRTVSCKWKNRFDELGPDGLGDRCSRPLHSPAAKGEVVEQIMHLRQDCHFGPALIAMWLKRCHDVEMSPSVVWRVGHRLGLGRLSAKRRCKRRAQRPKRCEKQDSGHRVQIGVRLGRPDGRRGGQAALPVHRHRGLHPAARSAHLPQKPTSAPRSGSSTTSPSSSRSPLR